MENKHIEVRDASGSTGEDLAKLEEIDDKGLGYEIPGHCYASSEVSAQTRYSEFCNHFKPNKQFKRGQLQAELTQLTLLNNQKQRGKKKHALHRFVLQQNEANQKSQRKNKKKNKKNKRREKTNLVGKEKRNETVKVEMKQEAVPVATMRIIDLRMS